MSAIQLTPHFKLSEFEFSTTALAKGFDNHCPQHLIPNLRNLCERILEPLRAKVNEPIIISSGYRCPQLNKAVGGVSNSQHMTGEACDIHLSDMKKLREWFTHLMEGDFDQLIMERASKASNHYWIHVSCRADPTKNRHQVKYITKA